MAICDTPKPCPHCHHLVDAAAARTSCGYACPNCNERINYVAWTGDHYIKADYRWAIPNYYGAMDLLDIEIASGEKGI